VVKTAEERTDPRLENAVEVSHLTKRFGAGDSSTLALEDINLSIGKGEFVTILGPSGCGKTTLLRIIGGLIQPTAGEVTVLGRAISGAKDADHRRTTSEIGFVFQEPNLMPWRTVRQNIELPLELRGTARRDRAAVAKELIDLVGLSSFADAYPRQLSGGMRQRVAIARALSYDPAVLLADEPFGALDAQTRDSMNLELQRIWMKSGKTVVLVTHSISEAVFLADRVILLSAHPGRLASITPIEFPRPRSTDLLHEPDFLDISQRLREELVV